MRINDISFLRMRTIEIAKSLGKCTPIEKIFRIIENRGRRSEWQGQIFDRKHLNSRFRACAVKMFLNVAQRGAIGLSLQRHVLYSKLQSLNTLVKAVFNRQ